MENSNNNAARSKAQKEIEDHASIECSLLGYRPVPDMDNRRRVIVHVTFLKIGEINTLKEVFEADVLLRTKWRLPELDIIDDNKVEETHFDLCKYWNPEVYIDNVVGEPKRTSSIHLEHDANGHAFVIERRRVRGSFLETMELWEFPFDIQDLSVTVMSEKAITDVELEEDPDEIHKIYKQSFIDEQEWHLYKYISSEKKEMQKDKADPTIFRSALTVRCKTARRPAFFLWNSFSVTFLICCLSFVTFAVKPELPQNRLQLSFTLVLTAVAFKFVVNQSLPKISYLTYLDRYIFATMVLLVSTCIWHGTQTVVNYERYPDADYIALAILAGAFICYNIQFFVRLYFVDRYVVATMVLLVSICIWHATQTLISHDRYPAADTIALVFLATSFICYNIIFIVRLRCVDRYVFATMVLLMFTNIWHGVQTLISYQKYPDADYIALAVLVAAFICYNLQFIIRLYHVDRYILATMICLVIVCAWHGTMTLIMSTVKNKNTVQIIDTVALCTLAASYVFYNVIFVTRLTIQPYKKRRYMKHLEKEYIAAVKKEAEIRQSTRRGPKGDGRTLTTVITAK